MQTDIGDLVGFVSSRAAALWPVWSLPTALPPLGAVAGAVFGGTFCAPIVSMIATIQLAVSRIFMTGPFPSGFAAR